ncbi:MAG: ABC transporter permease [Anaerolineae bacterium]|nr:ABC transporter permease [Chloroflexota bacterium]
MDDSTALPVNETGSGPQQKRVSGFQRVLRFTARRFVALFLTVLVGVYLTIVIANMGGAVDELRKGEIAQSIAMGVSMNPEMRRLDPEKRAQIIEEMTRLQEQRLGLDQPFAIRSLTFLRNAMLLDLGFAENLTSDSGSRFVRAIILERLPPTLLLMGMSYLLLFFISVFFALYLSRRYGSFLDRLVVTLAPTSSAPAWFYGLFLILIFAVFLGVLPYSGMVSAPPPANKFVYAASVARHLILPVAAVIVAAIWSSTYSWRTFFLIYSSEDYVEMAKAKGLSSREIENRYVLRPTLPTIITNFALLLIGLWTGAIILETVFNWPGLGRLFYSAINIYDTPVIVGETVIYAYLLAVTVFVLDFVYVLVDPRVRIGGGSEGA